jgi:hypothetical protein
MASNMLAPRLAGLSFRWRLHGYMDRHYLKLDAEPRNQGQRHCVVWRPRIPAFIWHTASGRVGHLVRIWSSTLGCSSRPVLRYCALRNLLLRLVVCGTSSPNVTPQDRRRSADHSAVRPMSLDLCTTPVSATAASGGLMTLAGAGANWASHHRIHRVRDRGDPNQLAPL